MVRWTVGLTSRILPVCLVLCLGVLIVGEQVRPESPPAVMETCKLPCWGGLVPGETPFGDVIPTLMANFPALAGSPPVLSGQLISFGLNLGGQPVSGIVHYAGGKAGMIQLHTALPFADLLETLGAPECVRLRLAEDSTAPVFLIDWRIEEWFVTTLLDTSGYRRLEPGMTAQDLEIGRGEGNCDVEAAAWLGFAPVWRYEVVAPPQ